MKHSSAWFFSIIIVSWVCLELFAEKSAAVSYDFALVNESKSPILISVKNGNKWVLLCYYVASRQNAALNSVKTTINNMLPTVLAIQTFNEPKSLKQYIFSLGKTIYVSWTSKDKLDPQVGGLYGLIPVSKMGMKLNYNVQLGDITLLDQ